MSDPIAYIYDAAQNPTDAFLPGVPLRDLTAAEVDALPEWLRRSVAACPFYAAPARQGPPLKGSAPKDVKE